MALIYIAETDPDTWTSECRLLHSQDDVSSSDDDIDLSSLCLLLIALAELSNENVEQHHHHNEQEQPVDQDSQPTVGKQRFMILPFSRWNILESSRSVVSEGTSLSQDSKASPPQEIDLTIVL